MNIKAIVFDWGGVLITDPSPAMTKYIARKINLPEADLLKRYSVYAREFGCGKITESDLWKNIDKVPKKLPYENYSLWLEAFKYAYSENLRIFEIAKNLSNNGFKIGLLSNTEPPVMHYYKHLNYSFVDQSVYSCAEGVMKPDHRIYFIIADRLRCELNEILFIDDKIENVTAAKETGMHAVQFSSARQFKLALKKYKTIYQLI